jgi:TatD DNase family protein
MLLFDTHAHYDDSAFDEDRDEVLKALPDANVALVMIPACDMRSSWSAAALAEKYPFVYAAAGVHPHEASEMRDGDLSVIAELLSKPKIKAIGEIGLDYHYDFSPREIQKQRFYEQLCLARDLDVPVIIHDREAHADCLELVKKSGVRRGVYHCYSGSSEQAKILLSMGFYISFTGNITFKNARKAYDVIRMMPEDRIMIETDSPYMTPEPFRGRRNDSRMVALVAEKIAEIRGASFEDTAKTTYENGRTFFSV